MHIALIGASNGVGLHLLHYLLPADHTISLLLRKPACFDNDEQVSAAIASGRVRVVQGDATVQSDVERLLEGKVDLVVSSIGGAPSFTLRGFVLDQPTVCTDGMLALLRALEAKPANERPRVVVISTMVLGDSHYSLPYAIRPLYHLLAAPHADKLGMEYLLHRASPSFTIPAPPTPPPHILSPDDAASVPEHFLPEVIILRPALLVGGERGLDAVRAGDVSVYTISREDVARFVVEKCMPGMGEWVGKGPVMGY